MKPINQIMKIAMVTSGILMSALVSRAQSFQNTYYPPGGDIYTGCSAVQGRYYAVGNSTSFSPAQAIVLSQYNNNGTVGFHRIIYDNTAPYNIYSANDMMAGYNNFISPNGTYTPVCQPAAVCPLIDSGIVANANPNSRNYLYICGNVLVNGTGNSRFFVCKTRNNGALIWSRISPVSSSRIETGVSVESCRNGDVMVVSEVFDSALGFTYPAITRIDSAGNLVWRYFYQQISMPSGGGWIPRQSCLFRDVQNGNSATAANPDGIAVTGYTMGDPATTNNFFVMRVNYNGNLIYSYQYPFPVTAAGTGYEEAYDIMPEAAVVVPNPSFADNFIVTGGYNPSGPPGPAAGPFASSAFTARIDARTGAFVNAFLYSLPVPAPPPPVPVGIMATSITQSISTAATVVLAGSTVEVPAVASDAVQLEVNPVTGVVFWIQRYPLTAGGIGPFGTVQSVCVNAGYPTPGYFLESLAIDPYALGTSTDAHVVRTDALGSVNSATCPAIMIMAASTPQLTMPVPECMKLVCDTIILITPRTLVVSTPPMLCYSAYKAMVSEANKDDLTVFPDPVTNQGSITVTFKSVVKTTGKLTLVDINGRELFSQTLQVKEGDNISLVDVSSFKQGIYAIKLNIGDNNECTKFVKVN